jgi:propanol-preferring alcohol dehydrogenase
LGPNATGVDLGKNYLVFPWLGCGDCIVCASGRENYCAKPRSIGIYQNGGYADHILVPDSRYLLDIGELNPAQIAPVACSGLTTYSAIKKLDPAIYQQVPIVIMGAGGLGLMCLQILKAMGGAGAIVVDIDPLKLKAAKEAGALATVNGTDPDALEQILNANGNQAIPAVIDLVGSAQSTALGFNALVKGGTLVIVGFFGGAAPWSLALIPMKAISILGNYTGSLGELQELLKLVKSGQVKPIEVSEHPLSEASNVLAALGAGKIIGRAVLVD